MSSRDILSRIDRYSSVRILCAGDVMLDRFVYGDVTRISPEAPIPVVSVREEKSMLGGAGNVVRNISSLGAGVDFVTVAGCDAAGEEILRELQALENCRARVVRDADRRTSVKIRYLARQQQILRVDAESTEALADERFSELRTHFSAALAECDAVLLSDYAKGVLSGDHASALIAGARAAGKAVLVDPKGQDFNRYRGAAIVKPNLSELRDAARMPVDSADAIECAARAVLDSSGIDAMLVTRGAAGMMLVRRNGPVSVVRGRAREVFDVSGAGDTAAASLAVAVAAGAALEEAMLLANLAAGIAVSKLGTATVTRDQLLWELEAGEAVTAESKIEDRDRAAERVARWRRAGLRVGAMAARFDAPRADFSACLKSARAECDKLVFVLLSASSAALPSPEETEACLLLSGLVWVDLVARCPEAAVAAFLSELAPDYVADDLPATGNR